MTRLGTSLLLLVVTAPVLPAASPEQKTLEKAAEAVRGFGDLPLQGIPRALVRDAAGVAVIPHAVRVGVLVDGRFGRGVFLVHEPNGCWSNPIFATLRGGGIGGEAGIEATQLVLIFKTRKSLDRALRGKLTLGGDIAVAAGPVGRDLEKGKDGWGRAEVCSYSKSRGLFVGLSLTGSRLEVDAHANEAFYGIHRGRAEDVLGCRGRQPQVVESLWAELTRLSAPPVIVVPAVKPPEPGRRLQ
jgi:lipid-binding SYLF domain-containing protein